MNRPRGEVTALVERGLQRQVDGCPAGVTFGTIVDLCLSKGATRVYAFGGFLRDAFCGPGAFRTFGGVSYAS